MGTDSVREEYGRIMSRINENVVRNWKVYGKPANSLRTRKIADIGSR